MATFEEIEIRVNDVMFLYDIVDCPANHLTSIINGEKIKFGEKEYSENTDGFYMVQGEKKAILINKNITPTERKTYTIAHELGHHFLNHIAGSGEMECKIMERTPKEDCPDKTKYRKETEADVFAAYLLMPKELVIPIVDEALKVTNRQRYGRFFLDNQRCNINDWKICCSMMRQKFKTSRTAIKWRLYNLGYLMMDIK